MAMIFGGLLALVHAFFCIHLLADQIVSGFAVNLLALGVTGFLYSSIYPDGITRVRVDRVPIVSLDFLGLDPRGSGDFWTGFRHRSACSCGSCSPSSSSRYVVLFKTTIGLRLRSVGEHPRAADAVGISVYGVRYVGRRRLRGARGARRRVPLDRVRRDASRRT